MNEDGGNFKGREFICSCGKSYLSYAALFTHIKQKHEGKVLYFLFRHLDLLLDLDLKEKEDGLEKIHRQKVVIQTQVYFQYEYRV